MSNGASDVKQVIERILISYGVKNRPEYSEITHVPLSTISNWVARGKVPGDYLIQCSFDTGADLKWLMDGSELTNVRFEPRHYPMQGMRLMEAMQNSGGKEVLQRIMQAYGFTMQKELGDHLDIPSGTMSAWVRREHFPGDVVIVCALDTGASLYWLATGIGPMNEQHTQVQPEQLTALPAGLRQITKYSIHTGQLTENGTWFCDDSLIDSTVVNPALVEKNGQRWCVDLDAKNIANGRWLVDVDGTADVYDVARLPGNRLSVKNGSSQFECLVDEVNCVGMVFLTLSKSL
ncbi:phage repressor protein CI [Klebsiella michiganensis]|nr:phage repressor protein CI [Klebsiella oxytoca]MBD0965785.1 phage repressor protein CI [Klebsiella michiganensis]SXX04891.1 CI repressor [Klebsiella pneumoniae]MBG2703053.1 helix-turn-helix domain-containing protein [Klebsiella michiganensis]MBZ7235895.1 phage repressor protein CI [Klebsiella michiganensis]